MVDLARDFGADPAFVASPSSLQAVSTKGFNRGEGLRCHHCGKFLNPLAESRFHFVPLNEFGPEEAWWECHPDCNERSVA
jgi:uncharacterized protein with PIN domain